MTEANEKLVVLIEDQPSDAGTIRSGLEKAINDHRWTLPILPQQGAYKSMEQFVDSQEGKEVAQSVGSQEGKEGATPRVFMIVDLFVAKGLETPNIVFHQLMSSFFILPIANDLSVVCGRLGVLAKLRRHYKGAHLEVFSYFPTYFAEQNERVEEKEGDLHSEYSIKKIREHVKWVGLEKLKALMPNNREVQDEATAVNFLQIRAMNDAICERLTGILTPNGGVSNITEIVDKTNDLTEGVKRLVTKVKDWYESPEQQ